jgi:hypothetical protein
MDGPRFTLRKRTPTVLGALILVGALATATIILTLWVTVTAPPAPTIVGGPTNPTGSTSATFSFTDSTPGVAFQCSLDGAAYGACSSGKSYGGLEYGKHTFRVTAKNGSSPTSRPASYDWVVDTGTSEGKLGFPVTSGSAPSTNQSGDSLSPSAQVISGGSAADNGVSFQISGGITGLSAPGVTQPLDLSFTNPFGFNLKVLSVTISVQHATTKGGNPNPGCDGSTNMVVTQGFSGPVTVSGRSTMSLQALGVSQAQWPQVQMPNLSTNQNASRGATFTFSYSGTATKG